MKKNELKKILKPLIKECIKEVIFEEGALSTIISEVMKGTSSSQQIVETRVQQPKQDFARQEKKLQEAKERKRKLLDSIGRDAYNGVNLFEGTTPAPAAPSSPQSQGPLSGVDPSDPGVDISSFMPGASVWQKMVGK